MCYQLKTKPLAVMLLNNMLVNPKVNLKVC